MIDNLKQVVEANLDGVRPLFLRNLLKEEIQNYVLNFVYNDKEYKELVFTGGTCLRKIYNLPRLSEDLDFDYVGEFDVNKFARRVQKYFSSNLQYKDVMTKVSGNGNTVFIKMPILEELGLGRRGEVLFVRCDFSKAKVSEAMVEVNQISNKDLVFFVRNYNLSTLFANKITAFLTREYFRGDAQDVSIKSRDVFDLVWFLAKVKKNTDGLQPDWTRLAQVLKKERNLIISDVIRKTQSIDIKQIRQDLDAFIESDQNIKTFSESFKDIISRGFRSFESEK